MGGERMGRRNNISEFRGFSNKDFDESDSSKSKILSNFIDKFRATRQFESQQFDAHSDHHQNEFPVQIH